MVKGISRRVVVVDSPDRRFFEQAIFIVRNDAAGEEARLRDRAGNPEAPEAPEEKAPETPENDPPETPETSKPDTDKPEET